MEYTAVTLFLMKSMSKKIFLEFFTVFSILRGYLALLFFPVGMKLILGRWEVTTLIGPSSLMSTPLWGR